MSSDNSDFSFLVTPYFLAKCKKVYKNNPLIRASQFVTYIGMTRDHPQELTSILKY